METLLPNVNTSEGCFEIGVRISNPVFTEDAINKRKHERAIKSNMHCINAGPFTSHAKRQTATNTVFALVLTVFLNTGEPVDLLLVYMTQ